MNAKTFKFVLLAAATILCRGTPASSQEVHWMTNYSKALELANTVNKPILLDFTGSDWCPYCISMKKETLDTPMFRHYAANNLVLVEVDFPHNKPQTDELKMQNRNLGRRFKVNIYPTFILVDKEGRGMGRQVGYLPGGPTAFIARLNSLILRRAMSGSGTGPAGAPGTVNPSPAPGPTP